MKQYTVAFTRIGRSHDVAPLSVGARDADHLAEQIYRYARPHLRSRDVDVLVDLDKMQGWITVGFNNGGDFAIEAGGAR